MPSSLRDSDRTVGPCIPRLKPGANRLGPFGTPTTEQKCSKLHMAISSDDGRFCATHPRPDENVCDCLGTVSKHHHSPSGRVGLSGPERAIRFAKYHGIHRKTARVRPLPREDLPTHEVNGRSANTFISLVPRITSSFPLGAILTHLLLA